MDESKKFGECLKLYRKQNGMTQEDLARKLNTTKQVISNYENNRRSPDIYKAYEISQQLGVQFEDMLGTTKKDYREEQLIIYYRALSDEGKDELIKRASEMVFVYGKKNKKTTNKEAL